MADKTHYRKVFKSDHLGVADLEDLVESGAPLIFTIKQVKQEIDVMVAGHKGKFNIAYFNEAIKPWVVNAGNCKILKKFAGSPYVEKWAGLTIQLYIDPSAKLKGEIVGGVRINPTQPKTVKEALTPESERWPEAVKAYKRDLKFDNLEKRVTISKASKERMIAEADHVG